VEPTLMVVGLNHLTAPLATRERFFIAKDRRYEVLRQLRTAEGIEELVVVSTCCRTEFLLWASEPTLAANSLIHYLATEHGLKLSEWEHFYRRLDDAALNHIFRVTCGLDCQRLCEADVSGCMRIAWEQARTVGASGRFLNALLERAISVSERVSDQTRSAKRGVTVPSVALELARRIFGSLEGRKLLLLGTEKSEPCARLMCENGTGPVVVIDQSPARAQELATKLGGTAAAQTDRWSCLLRADIVVSATGTQHFVLTREEAERIATERNRVPMVVFDICIPRNVDPEVRRVDGILLYDYEGLDRAARNPVIEPSTVPTDAEKTVMGEIEAFRNRLKTEVVVPTSVALSQRLEEICRKEFESFTRERGPFTREQDHLLRALIAQVAQGIAGSLARELKELPESEEQEKMAAAVARLFRLHSQPAMAGSKREKGKNEPKDRPIAINS
jgi:glutamyl-tRNA reductase